MSSCCGEIFPSSMSRRESLDWFSGSGKAHTECGRGSRAQCHCPLCFLNATQCAQLPPNLWKALTGAVSCLYCRHLKHLLTRGMPSPPVSAPMPSPHDRLELGTALATVLQGINLVSASALRKHKLLCVISSRSYSSRRQPRGSLI